MFRRYNDFLHFSFTTEMYFPTSPIVPNNPSCIPLGSRRHRRANDGPALVTKEAHFHILCPRAVVEDPFKFSYLPNQGSKPWFCHDSRRDSRDCKGRRNNRDSDSRDGSTRRDNRDSDSRDGSNRRNSRDSSNRVL